MGTDQSRAIQAATILNAKIAMEVAERDATLLVNRVIGSKETAGEYIKRFRTQILPERRNRRGSPLSEKTLREYGYLLDHMADRFGHLPFPDISRRAVAKFLAGYPPRASNAHRDMMVQLWTHAIADGLSDINTPDQTIPRVHVVARDPLPLDTFKAIYKIAPEWFQIALDAALQTVQRREDLVGIRLDNISESGLEIIQRKTGLKLLIPCGAQLTALISRSRASNIPSPYLIHRKPLRLRRAYADAKGHWTQVKPEMLSRTFMELRDKTKLHECSKSPPTFHEIRGLGAEMYRQGGWAESAIQLLLGHATESMTRQYLNKHKPDTVLTPAAGLTINV